MKCCTSPDKLVRVVYVRTNMRLDVCTKCVEDWRKHGWELETIDKNGHTGSASGSAP